VACFIRITDKIYSYKIYTLTLTIWICNLHKHLLTVGHAPYWRHTGAVHLTTDTSLHTQLKADHPENAFSVITTTSEFYYLTKTWCLSYEQYACPQFEVCSAEYILVYLQMTRRRVNYMSEYMKTCTANTTQYICVCMCVCVWMYMYVCIYVCMYLFIYVWICVCVYIYVYMCVYVDVYVYVCIYERMCTCVYIHTRTHMYVIHKYIIQVVNVQNGISLKISNIKLLH
jgi:hypothetical protein